jgi:hypothetical protein
VATVALLSSIRAQQWPYDRSTHGYGVATSVLDRSRSLGRGGGPPGGPGRRSRAELRPLVLKRTGWDPLSNQAWEMLRDRYGYVGEQVSLELVVS